MNSDVVVVFQKNWAFTSLDSEKFKIKTGSFGPCYVVTFTCGKFAAMAHIDDNTDVNSITDVFKRFIERSISLKDVNVVVLGGWKEDSECFKFGERIVTIIKKYGFENINTKNMYSKKALTVFQRTRGIPQSDVPNHYHLGALVDSSSGQTFLLKNYSIEIENEQVKQTIKFVEKYSSDLNTEISLTEVVE